MRVERLVREAGIQLERSLLVRSRTVRQRRRPMSEVIVEERRFLERSKRRRKEEMQERMGLEMFFQSERGFGCAEGTMARGAFGRRIAASTELLVFGRCRGRREIKGERENREGGGKKKKKKKKKSKKGR
ncbi:hypothetical protein AAC387_Pa05g2769 [Persea americana]